LGRRKRGIWNKIKTKQSKKKDMFLLEGRRKGYEEKDKRRLNKISE